MFGVVPGLTRRGARALIQESGNGFAVVGCIAKLAKKVSLQIQLFVKRIVGRRAEGAFRSGQR
jgi:hypothetical protein